MPLEVNRHRQINQPCKLDEATGGTGDTACVIAAARCWRGLMSRTCETAGEVCWRGLSERSNCRHLGATTCWEGGPF